MKKTGVINQPISALIASLGHTDQLVIADAGLPVPPQVPRIDLALKAGLPAFLDTLQVVLSEMQVERAIIAQELPMTSQDVFEALQEMLGDIPIETIPHEELKAQTHSARGVIRTGEFTPYSNVILFAGVVF